MFWKSFDLCTRNSDNWDIAGPGADQIANDWKRYIASGSENGQAS